MRTTIGLLALAFCAAALAAAPDVDGVLAKMDAAAAKFTGVRANVEKASYTAIIDDTTTEKGTMWLARAGGKSEMRMRIEFTEPDPRTVAFAGKKAEIFYPKIKTVHEYDLSKHRSLVESFLLLGFGTTGRDLARDFAAKLAGEETVEDVPAFKLDLTPKSTKMQEQIARVELWVAKEGAYPVRQKFHTPGGDATTITYREIELNPKLSEKDLALTLPPGVQREFPQR